MSQARWSLAAALFTMVLWGANFAFVKYVLDALGVGAFLFIRFLATPLLAFLLLAFVFRNRIARTWPKRDHHGGHRLAQFGGGRPLPRESVQADTP